MCIHTKREKYHLILITIRMVTFLAAIAIASFLKMPSQPPSLFRGIFAGVWIFILPLIIWTVFTGWETTQKTYCREVAVVKWWQAHSDIVKSLEERIMGGGDIESGHLPHPPPSVGETDTETGSQNTIKPRRPSWRPRFRVPGPVRRLTSSYP